MTGYVHSYESFATLDGTGIRFAIFFQGCNLRCAYCHNPDTQAIDGGTGITTDELVKKVLRYKPYFARGGGVTLTGGEPLLQAEFLCELCEKLKNHGIHIALDTSGSVTNAAARRLIPLIDHFIVDLKFATEHDYKTYAGGSLEQTLEFLRLLSGASARLWLRSVIVPGINDTPEYMEKYKQITRLIPYAEKHELLAFHTLGFEKYRACGMENPLEGTPSMDEQKLKELQLVLEST